MTLEEFKSEIESAISTRPSYIRYGQDVFNYIDKTYHIARIAQFELGVDCFYDDTKVDEFINVCYKLIEQNENI